MQVPNDMLSQSNEAVVILQRPQYTNVICGFTYFSGRQLYTLQDFEQNREAVIANEITAMELGAWSIIGGEYTMLNTHPAYRVDIQLSEEQNAEFATYAITPREGFGVYLLHIGQRLDDPNLERHRLENEAMLQSIAFTGPPDTGLTLYRSLYMSVQFVYANALLPGGLVEYPEQDGLVANVQLFVQDRKDLALFLEDASGYATDIRDAVAQIDEAIETIDPKCKKGNLYTQMYGAQEYSIKEYDVEGADTGEQFHVVFAITDLDGHLYSLYVWYAEGESESVLAQMNTVMATLRSA